VHDIEIRGAALEDAFIELTSDHDEAIERAAHPEPAGVSS
jgi:hypothetical protein